MSERGLIIGFGTLFKAAENAQRVDVVVNVGEEGWCSVAQLVKNESGEDTFFIPGTATEDDIGEIVGQMGVEDVVKAAELGAKRAGLEGLPDSMRKLLEKYSKAKPRILR